MKRFDDITSINPAVTYGHKINTLLLVYLVGLYYMWLMLGRNSLLLNCL